PGALTMDQRRIVNGGVDLVGAEVGLERVATSRADHVLMVDVDPARIRGRDGYEGREAAIVVPGNGAASAIARVEQAELHAQECRLQLVESTVGAIADMVVLGLLSVDAEQ